MWNKRVRLSQTRTTQRQLYKQTEKREVIDVKENTKHLAYQFLYIFAPDFMKGESLPQLPKTLPASIVEVVHEIVPIRKAEVFYPTEVE